MTWWETERDTTERDTTERERQKGRVHLDIERDVAKVDGLAEGDRGEVAREHAF